MKKTDVHTSHCCVRHGCKYGKKSCTVTRLELEQEYPCEYCEKYGEGGEVVGPEPILKGRQGVLDEIMVFNLGIDRFEELIRQEQNQFVLKRLKGMTTAAYVQRSSLKRLLK